MAQEAFFWDGFGWNDTDNLWVWNGSSWKQIIAAWVWNGSSFVKFYDGLPGPLDHIIVTPSSVNLTESQTQQFTAAGFDIHLRPVSISPVWTVDSHDCTIDAGTGLFTAGSGSGTIHVQASVGAVAGDATVFQN